MCRHGGLRDEGQKKKRPGHACDKRYNSKVKKLKKKKKKKI